VLAKHHVTLPVAAIQRCTRWNLGGREPSVVKISAVLTPVPKGERIGGFTRLQATDGNIIQLEKLPLRLDHDPVHEAEGQCDRKKCLQTGAGGELSNNLKWLAGGRRRRLAVCSFSARSFLARLSGSDML